MTPGVQGSGSETEGEEESPQEEHEDTTRRMVSTVKAASRRLSASCRQGAAPNSCPTPPVSLKVMAKATEPWRSGLIKEAIPDTGCD